MAPVKYLTKNLSAILAWLIVVGGVCGYVYRMERRQNRLEVEIAVLEDRTKVSFSLVVQALAQLSQRFNEHVAAKDPGTF